MSPAPRLPANPLMVFLRRSRLIGAVMIVASGCSENASPADQTVGAPVTRTTSSAGTRAPMYAFTTYLPVSAQFTIPAGLSVGSGYAACPAGGGYQVTGGGVQTPNGEYLNTWVIESSPGYDANSDVYFWHASSGRSTRLETTQTLTVWAVCVS